MFDALLEEISMVGNFKFTSKVFEFELTFPFEVWTKYTPLFVKVEMLIWFSVAPLTALLSLNHAKFNKAI